MTGEEVYIVLESNYETTVFKRRADAKNFFLKRRQDFIDTNHEILDEEPRCVDFREPKRSDGRYFIELIIKDVQERGI